MKHFHELVIKRVNDPLLYPLYKKVKGVYELAEYSFYNLNGLQTISEEEVELKLFEAEDFVVPSQNPYHVKVKAGKLFIDCCRLKGKSFNLSIELIDKEKKIRRPFLNVVQYRHQNLEFEDFMPFNLGTSYLDTTMFTESYNSVAKEQKSEAYQLKEILIKLMKGEELIQEEEVFFQNAENIIYGRPIGTKIKTKNDQKEEVVSCKQLSFSPENLKDKRGKLVTHKERDSKSLNNELQDVSLERDSFDSIKQRVLQIAEGIEKNKIRSEEITYLKAVKKFFNQPRQFNENPENSLKEFKKELNRQIKNVPKVVNYTTGASGAINWISKILNLVFIHFGFEIPMIKTSSEPITEFNQLLRHSFFKVGQTHIKDSSIQMQPEEQRDFTLEEITPRMSF